MLQLELNFNQVSEDKFNAYHNANPQIYEQFKKFSLQAIRKGRTRLSAKFVFEEIRWSTRVAGNDGFKLNNNYHSFYSRKFEREYPEFKDYFKKRNSKADLKSV